jgi:hypothetical protein
MKEYEYAYIFLKIILNILMIIFLKHLLFSSYKISYRQRVSLVFLSSLVIAFNLLGLVRNAGMVMISPHLVSTWVWTFLDILQTALCIGLYFIFYFKENFNKFLNISLIICSLSLVVFNIYNFQANFEWIGFIPDWLILFWFTNNSLMIFFGFYILYLIFSSKLSSR